MNRNLIATVIAIGLLGSQAYAQTDPAQETHEHETANAAMQDQMHARMDKMQAKMKEIHAADDPEVRKQLMHEHMQEMRSVMKMMGGMNGMMGGGMMGGHGSSSDNERQPMMRKCQEQTAQCKQMNSMAERQEHMARKMGMMQMMMQQMMERDAVESENTNHNHE